jgi:hypothetical protein
MFTELHMKLIPKDLHELIRPQINWSKSTIKPNEYFNDFKLYYSNDGDNGCTNYVREMINENYKDLYNYYQKSNTVYIIDRRIKTSNGNYIKSIDLSFHKNGTLRDARFYYSNGSIKEIYIFHSNGERKLYRLYNSNKELIEENDQCIKWDENDKLKEVNKELIDKNKELIDKNKELIDKNKELIDENKKLKENLEKITELIKQKN